MVCCYPLTHWCVGGDYDECLGADYYKLDTKSMDVNAAVITCPDLGAFAVWMGARGKLARSNEELREAAKAGVASPGPMIIKQRISRTAPSVPYRRIHYGLDK